MAKSPGRKLRKFSHGKEAHKYTNKRSMIRKQSLFSRSTLTALRTGLLSLARAAIKKLLLIKRAVSTKRGTQRAVLLRYAVIAGSLAVVTTALLLIFLVPGGEAAPASGTQPSSAVAFVTQKPSPSPSTSASTLPTTTTADATDTAAPSPSPTQKPKPTATKPKTPGMDELVEYYRVDADSYYSDFHYSSNHYDYTEDELMMMAKIIKAEAGGEPFEGKIAIGNVVINRTLCGHWGSTIADQTKGLAYNPNTVPSQACIDAARVVLDDEVWVVPQNTYNFKTSGGDWRTFKLWGQIGHHYFYTYHYGSRCESTTPPPALFKRVFKYAQYGCKPADRVFRIQYMLHSLGYKVTPDRYFGEDTKKALIAFQKSKGLKADGVAGPATVEALIRAFGVDKYLKQFS